MTTLHLTLDTGATPIKETYEQLIEGLDEIYEEFFWRKARREYISNAAKENKTPIEITLGKWPDTNSKVYPSLAGRLASFFTSLDRSHWSDDATKFIKGYIKSLEEKYKDREDSSSKITNEFLLWLCDQKWHILNELIVNPISFFSKVAVEELATTYGDKYNKIPTRENLLVCGYEVDTSVEEEIRCIRMSLQNIIDIHLVENLLTHISDLQTIISIFERPHYRKLSQHIDDFVADMLLKAIRASSQNRQLQKKYNRRLSGNTYHKSCYPERYKRSNKKRYDSTIDIVTSLAGYLESIIILLENYDDRYKRYGIADYVLKILNDEKTIDDCCEKIYTDVFIKIQVDKSKKYNERKDRQLKESLDKSVGKTFTNIIKTDSKNKL